MKAQSTVIGFLAITAIAVIIAGTTFFWAKPLFDKTLAQDEVLRIENRMLETHAAIVRAASTQSQTTVDFDINKGILMLSNNSIIFRMQTSLPNPYDDVVLLGNGTYDIGTLGVDEPAYVLEQGSYQAKLHYRVLNDTSANKCAGILLEPGAQVAIGEGRHNIFLKWIRVNATTVTGCSSTILQVIQVDML